VLGEGAKDCGASLPKRFCEAKWSKTLGFAWGIPYRRDNFGDSGVSMRKVVFLKR